MPRPIVPTMRSGQSSNVLERRASDGTGTPDSHAATFTHDFECLITCGWCKTQPFTDTGLDDAPNNNGAPIVGKCGHTVCLDCLIVAAYYQDELFRKSKLQCKSLFSCKRFLLVFGWQPNDVYDLY
jgi:hypothetical protein